VSAENDTVKILRVNMKEETVSHEPLARKWHLVGGRGLIAGIMREEVPPETDPVGAGNKIIIACGPLAGTNAPQLGRISLGAKSPLTFGVKESNAGGPAAQKLDRLGIRGVIIEGTPSGGRLFVLHISGEGAELHEAGQYRSMGVFELVELLQKKYGTKHAYIGIGPAGERLSSGSSVFLTDMRGDPSRQAGRGGLGAVLGSKGIKAIVIDDEGVSMPQLSDRAAFRSAVREWVAMIRKDVVCNLFSTEGTPFTIASNSYQGTMPGNNYRTGRPDGFERVTGEVIRRRVHENGGYMHGCMPGCVVKCSINYVDAGGKAAAAYEYEAVSLIGTNLGLTDPDIIGDIKHRCDDIGLDFIELGSALGLVGEKEGALGNTDFFLDLMDQVRSGSGLGRTLGNGVVETARKLGISRVPAVKGQALPAHDPRAVKGIGVTYRTSPMGADHTAGLTYRNPLAAEGQVMNSLRFQLRAAACDTFGYCLNAMPGRQASIYDFAARLLNARFGVEVTADDIMEIAKQTIRDERAFNEKSGFETVHGPFPEFLRNEPLPPTNQVFDVDEDAISKIWDRMEDYREPVKVWEVRFPRIPAMLFGIGTGGKIGKEAARLGMKSALIIADPVMEKLGRTEEIKSLLAGSGVSAAVFTGVQPDPPIESIEKAARVYDKNGCDGLIAVGGGSSIDTAKATSVRVSQSGPLREYENMVGGKAKIKPPVPPLIAVPTTSGTGSETNQFAIVTDSKRNVKFTVMSDHIIPALAVLDPRICSTMPKPVTAQTGIDALAHCVEGYTGMNDEYHPYYEALALYGVQLVGRSLRRAFENGDDLEARRDMCMAASFGGISFTKGLGLGHAISHVLGAFHHLSHGSGCALGLLCHVRANEPVCADQYSRLAWALGGGDGLLDALINLYRDLSIPTRIREAGISERDLDHVAFETAGNAVNLAANPYPMSEKSILRILKEFY